MMRLLKNITGRKENKRTLVKHNDLFSTRSYNQNTLSYGLKRTKLRMKNIWYFSNPFHSLPHHPHDPPTIGWNKSRDRFQPIAGFVYYKFNYKSKGSINKGFHSLPDVWPPRPTSSLPAAYLPPSAAIAFFI